MPVCDKNCEEGLLHSTYECKYFADAIVRSGKKLPDSLTTDPGTPCPLYASITPLRFLLRVMEAKNNKEEVIVIL